MAQECYIAQPEFGRIVWLTGGARETAAGGHRLRGTVAGTSIQARGTLGVGEVMSMLPFDDRDGQIWFDGELLPWREAQVLTR